jgi:MFS family permease
VKPAQVYAERRGEKETDTKQRGWRRVFLTDQTAESSEEAVLTRVGLRLLPFLFLLYVVNILDRVNVGFAKLQMLPALGLDGDRGDAVFALGAGIFYIGYLVFEVPSNLILQRVGARTWIARIMVSWGVISAAMMFVREPWGFYALRFLLGVAEAGFFPGIILYLSHWFPTRQRARATAFFMIASPVAGVIGNPLSGWLLQYLDKVGGLAGWQWLFLVEGLPSVLLGIGVWFYLDDRPEQAAWLTPGEQDWLADRLRHEARRRELSHGLSRLSALAHPRVWLLIALYFTPAVGTNALGFYAPTIIQDEFSGRSAFVVGVLAALPSVAALIGQVVASVHSDRTGERRLHVAVAALLGAGGWGLGAAGVVLHQPWLVLAGLVTAQMGMMSMLPTFWTLATSFLSGTAAAGGIALINSVANFGGFVAPILVARLKVVGGSYAAPMLVLVLTMAAGAVLALCVRHDPSLEK